MQLNSASEYIGYKVFDSIDFPVGHVEYAYHNEDGELIFQIDELGEKFEIVVNTILNENFKTLQIWVA